MNRIVRYMLLFLVVFALSLFVWPGNSGTVYAEDDESEANYTVVDRVAAIRDANNAILSLPRVSYIVALDQKAIGQVGEARELVEIAINQFNAEESDFPNLDKLLEAEAKVNMLLAAKDAQDAIRALPPLEEITGADRAAVEEARRLVNIAVDEHNATRFNICWYLDTLEEAEEIIGEEVEPEPTPSPEKPDDDQPTPPTGGIASSIAAGLLLAGFGFLFIRNRKGL